MNFINDVRSLINFDLIYQVKSVVIVVEKISNHPMIISWSYAHARFLYEIRVFRDWFLDAIIMRM